MESLKSQDSPSPSPKNRPRIVVSPPRKCYPPSGSLNSYGSLSYESVSHEHLEESARPTFFFNRSVSARVEGSDHSMDGELNVLKSAFLSHKLVHTLVKSQFLKKELFKNSSTILEQDKKVIENPAISASPIKQMPPALPGLLQIPGNPKAMYQQTRSADDVGMYSTGMIGNCNREERLRKLARYIEKRKKWRAEHSASRKFAGRSRIAETKPRYKGRFIKLSTVKPKEEETNQLSHSDSMGKENDYNMCNSPKAI